MQAAERLRITAQEHYRLKIADGIIPVSTLALQYVFHVYSYSFQVPPQLGPEMTVKRFDVLFFWLAFIFASKIGIGYSFYQL